MSAPVPGDDAPPPSLSGRVSLPPPPPEVSYVTHQLRRLRLLMEQVGEVATLTINR